MTKKIVALAILSLLVINSRAAAQIGFGMDMGVGTRALSMAGNHVAVAKDLSAVYWNPAALAYLPVREFQVTFDGMRTLGTCEITGSPVTIPSGAKNDDYRDRLRFSGAGAMTAIPTIQGGLTIAAAYESPKTFDDFSVYTYMIDDMLAEENLVKYGDLRRLSVAFGIQVAPNASAGLSLSVLTGGAQTTHDQKRNGAPYNDMDVDHSYLGYSLTAGALYMPLEYLKLGMRFNTVMSLGVKETWMLKYESGQPMHQPNGRPERLGPFTGKGYIAPQGALGAGLTLPWMTTALDIRFTMPYTFVLPGENIAEDLQARYFKMGGGLGFEAPIPSTPVVLRAGYSFDECDLFMLVHRMGDKDVGWDDIDWEEGRGFDIVRNKHTLAFGAGLFTAGTGIELSYGWQTWGISHRQNLWRDDDPEAAPVRIGHRTLKQIYSNHRLMAAVIVRY